MKADFWLSKWQKNEIGFHLPKPHPWLVAYLPKFPLSSASSVFVPLCGKSLDIDYLLEQGHSVIGNELSQDAVQEVFDRLNLKPNVSTWEGGTCYEANKLTIYVGDYFKLTSHHLPTIELVYDRAAMIALPEDMRVQYVQQLNKLCPNAIRCLITLEYDQSIMSGPPFSVSEKEVETHFAGDFKIEQLKRDDIIEHEAKFKQNGLPELLQCLYYLTPNSKPYGS